MLAELLSENSLGGMGTGEDHEAAGFAVEAVDGADGGRDALGARAFDFGDDVWEHFVERGLDLLAALGPIALFAMAVGGYPGGFFDDDQMLVEILDFDVVLSGRRGGWLCQYLHDVSGLKTPPGIRAGIAVNGDMSRLDQFAQLRPGVTGQRVPKCG